MIGTLREIRGFRRHLKLKRFRYYESLVKQARSGKLDTRDKAEAQFAVYWKLDPSKSSQNAPSIDLMEMLKPYSIAERRAIVKHLVGLQLTEGCNGKCYFCSFGPKNGVKAKLSFGSIRKFLEFYGHLFNPNYPSDPYEEIFPNWDSDFLDYRDGEYDCCDIFLLLRKYIKSIFIPTALPIGSEASFMRLLQIIVLHKLWKKTEKPTINIRLSVSAKNCVRFEAVLACTIANLRRAGISQEEIDTAFKSLIDIAYRTGRNIYPFGENLIKMADPLRDCWSPGCADGVVIKPRRIQATIVVSSSSFHPSGEFTVDLLPGETLNKIPEQSNRAILVPTEPKHLPEYLRVMNTGFYHMMAPTPMAKHGERYWLFFAQLKCSKTKQISLFLSRNALALRIFLRLVRKLSYSPRNSGPILTNRYLREALRWHESQKRIYDLVLDGARELASWIPESAEKRELIYMIEVAEANLKLVDALFELVRRKGNPEAIAIVVSHMCLVTLKNFYRYDSVEGGIQTIVNNTYRFELSRIKRRKKRESKKKAIKAAGS